MQLHKQTPLDLTVFIILSLSALGCQPGNITGGGEDFGTSATGDTSDGDGDTGETGTDGDDAPRSDGDTKCVEMAGVTSCWVMTSDGWAQALLPCQIDEALAAGIITLPTSVDLEGWGTVECYDFTTSDASFCMFESAVLTPNGLAVWDWFINDDVEHLEAVPPPCSPGAQPGDMWEPCPMQGGVPTLCHEPGTACVPADRGDANMCLPIGSCPMTLPFFGEVFDLGWGDACYPRCSDDAACAEGQVCATALADDGPMCAWPVSP